MAARRQQRAVQRHEEILDAALAVFARRGFDGASMKEIGEEAGVTPGLLYHYFPGKRALLEGVLAERSFLPQLRDSLAVSAGRPASEVLCSVAGGFAELLAERSEVIRVMWTGAFVDPELRQVLADYIGQGRALLAHYLNGRVAAGELREHDADAAAMALLAPIVLGRVSGLTTEPKQIVAVLLEGLSREGGGDGGAAPTRGGTR